MYTIFLKELKRTRRSMCLWSLVIGILAVFGILEYPIISGYMKELIPILQSIPKLIQIMFGVYKVDLTNPLGYYACMYFWCGLVVFTHAVYIGASMISKDERDKTTEYLFSKPYKRDTIITAKILVAAVNTLVIAVITGTVSALAMLPLGVGTDFYLHVATVTLGMFFTQLVLASLGFACSALFKKPKTGILAAVFVLILSYIFAIFIEYNGRIDFLNFISPIRYFNVKSVMNNGISFPYMLISAVVILTSIYVTIMLYRKRDFHI